MSANFPAKRARPMRHAVIFGGAGFIGSNVANRLLSDGQRVLIFDNLARPGVQKNLSWLEERHGELLRIQLGDVRDADSVRRAVRGAGEVFHFAAQVAVTTSLDDPLRDFEVNARGTFNVLEAIRAQESRPSLLFTSTNKVYGGLCDLPVRVEGCRYQPVDPAVRLRGVGEGMPLDFESPYGCSKGCADQYVLDYARSFGVPAAVFRMSCIYGPRQFGTEDQGWLAHFLIRSRNGSPLTIYGDGMQVRDVLYIDDLVEAMLLAQDAMPRISGQAFNVGGGPERTISLLELMELIRGLHGSAPSFRRAEWRTGDQRYYVSDTSKLQAAVGWTPRVSVEEGVRRLDGWLGGLDAAAADDRLLDEATAG
jgi:CDP-paratose 2-epimerase